MLLYNLGDISDASACRPLMTLPVWERHVEGVTRVEWVAVHKLISTRHGEAKARICMNQAIAEATKQYLLDDFRCDLLHFQMPTEKLGDFGFHQLLSAMSPEMQQLVGFALFEDMSLVRAKNMTYEKMRLMKLTEETKLALFGKVRHFRSPKVFWELESENVRLRLFDEIGLGWAEFKDLADRVMGLSLSACQSAHGQCHAELKRL